jgi:hypothetical protein
MYRALIGVGAACGIAGMTVGAISERWSMRAPYPVGERTNRLDWSSAGSSIVVKPIYILQPKAEALPVFESLPVNAPPLPISDVVESSESSEDEPRTVEAWRRPLEPQPSWVDHGPVCHKEFFWIKRVQHWRCRYW